MRCKWMTAGLLLLASSSGFAFSISDDFESYGLGTFPSANWFDVGQINPQGNIPNPSALIERKTTESGTQTKAVNFGDFYGYSSGIGARVAPDRLYSLQVDVRVDRFGTEPADVPFSDWPVAVGYNSYNGDINPSSWNSIQVYASTLTKGWRIYAYDGTNQYDLDLTSAVPVGIWCRVNLLFDNATGVATTSILNLRTNSVIENRVDTLQGWQSPELDVLAAFDGDSNFADSNAVPGLANIDNIVASSVPEPSTIALLGIGAVALLRRSRTRKQ